MIERTLERLYQLGLTAMVEAVEEQRNRGQVDNLSFEERLCLIVDRQWEARQQKRTDRRLKQAKLKQGANSGDIDFRHKRGLDKAVILDLLECNWIKARRNVILTGATGLGKTWIACALADRACRCGLTAYYQRVPRLVEELNLARADGSYLRLLAKLAKFDLLILDDWGLAPLNGAAQHDILEVIDDRAGIRSTLVTSQLPVAKWHAMVADPSVADALLDRIVGSSHQIALKGESKRSQLE